MKELKRTQYSKKLNLNMFNIPLKKLLQLIEDKNHLYMKPSENKVAYLKCLT
jgi:hypothetical protein